VVVVRQPDGSLKCVARARMREGRERERTVAPTHTHTRARARTRCGRLTQTPSTSINHALSVALSVAARSRPQMNLVVCLLVLPQLRCVLSCARSAHSLTRVRRHCRSTPRRCSPFHVRFGKLNVWAPAEKVRCFPKCILARFSHTLAHLSSSSCAPSTFSCRESCLVCCGFHSPLLDTIRQSICLCSRCMYSG
jgi:hypothetical protein